MITKKINDRIDEIAKEMKPVLASKLDDLEWLYEHGAIDSWKYEMYKNTGFPNYLKSELKYKKQYAYSAFGKEIGRLGVGYNANLSDIVEEATCGKVSVSYGHGAKYWKDRKIGDVNTGLAKEAFAEMINSTFANEKQLEAITKYL